MYGSEGGEAQTNEPFLPLSMGDSDFRSALRARLTELVASGADEIEETARNTEINADQAPESEATFGAKKEVTESGTEGGDRFEETAREKADGMRQAA